MTGEFVRLVQAQIPCATYVNCTGIQKDGAGYERYVCPIRGRCMRNFGIPLMYTD